jgi:hypothetical protein
MNTKTYGYVKANVPMHPRKPRIAVFDFLDARSQTNLGHIVANQLAQRLVLSRHYLLIKRHIWKEAVGVEKEIRQELRFHAAWAANAGSMACADAVVIGKLQHSASRGNGIVRMALLLSTRTGEPLFRVEHATFDKLLKKLDSRSLAASVPVGKRRVRAEICCVSGDQTVLNSGRESGLLRKDRMRIERILSKIPDPYDPDSLKMLPPLVVIIGEMEVLKVGQYFSLARYCGGRTPQVGDLCVLVED